MKVALSVLKGQSDFDYWRAERLSKIQSKSNKSRTLQRRTPCDRIGSCVGQAGTWPTLISKESNSRRRLSFGCSSIMSCSKLSPCWNGQLCLVHTRSVGHFACCERKSFRGVGLFTWNVFCSMLTVRVRLEGPVQRGITGSHANEGPRLAEP
eukprot:6456766-Amphidinium_carterae.1